MIITNDRFVDMMGRMNEDITQNSGYIKLRYNITARENGARLVKAM